MSSTSILNSTFNSSILVISHNRDYIIENRCVQAFFCVLYTTIFVLGLFGNLLVCYVVCRNKAMQTVTNLFITNLALSDILLCVLAVPFTPTYTFLGRWMFGNILCHLVPYAQGCSVYISTLTLTSIAIDRYFVIIYPFRPRMLLSTCILIILGIWIFSLLITLPYGVYMAMTPYKLNDTASDISDLELIWVCEESWPSEFLIKIFGSLTTTLQFIVPFLVIAFCYIRVSVRLNDRSRARPGTKNSQREEADRDRKRRTNRMLIAMVTIFGVSWLPINAINIVNDFVETTWTYANLCFFFAHSLAMSSTCYNPFLYAWLNENFRKEFKQVFPCFDQIPRAVLERINTKKCEPTGNDNDVVQESLLTSINRRTSETMPGDISALTNSPLDAIQETTERSSSKGELVTLHIITSETKPPGDLCLEHSM